MGGRPVPWTAPVIAGEVAWSALTTSRVQEADARWLCQLCGRELEPTAWAAVAAGEVATGGPLHRPCLALAWAYCPALSDEAYVFVEAYRAELARDGAGLIARLIAYEEAHGMLPVLLPLASAT